MDRKWIGLGKGLDMMLPEVILALQPLKKVNKLFKFLIRLNFKREIAIQIGIKSKRQPKCRI